MQEIKLPLTLNQRKTLHFISDFIDMKGYPPTIGEIQENLGYRNPGYVHKVLSSLERKGYITRKKGEHRGIRLSELSENMLANRQMSFLKNDEEKN